ncbi:MAG TPA: transglycosylase SLT domain-containing protein, partial [Ignavibacteria bacterium]
MTVNLKAINFHNFFKIPVYVLVLMFIVLVSAIIIRFVNYDKAGFETSNPNPESIIPPVETKGKENSDDPIKNISINNAIYVEDMVYNWQNILDVFAYNFTDSALTIKDSTSTNQIISKILKNPNRKFSKGPSDEVLAQYGDVLLEECAYYKLDWRLILAMMKQESAFVSDAVSHAGAYGFMQIMPRTGSMLEQQLKIEEHRSPKNNLIAGIYYYATLVGRYHEAGDTNKYKFALAAYNAG